MDLLASPFVWATIVFCTKGFFHIEDGFHTFSDEEVKSLPTYILATRDFPKAKHLLRPDLAVADLGKRDR